MPGGVMPNCRARLTDCNRARGDHELVPVCWFSRDRCSRRQRQLRPPSRARAGLAVARSRSNVAIAMRRAPRRHGPGRSVRIRGARRARSRILASRCQLRGLPGGDQEERFRDSHLNAKRPRLGYRCGFRRAAVRVSVYPLPIAHEGPYRLADVLLERDPRRGGERVPRCTPQYDFASSGSTS